ncbi:MAG: SDR family oxidoreductase [Candidatus Bathyarchaeota archaeon]|nr:SDR family oxidoreductase [Candidatus Bathyarchaeota archaeon]
MRFKNKVVLITGGASGIGRETAIQFAKNGAKIGIFDLDQKKIQSVRKEIMSYCDDYVSITGDVRDKKRIQECVNTLFEKYSNIDYLINSAGILKDDMIDRVSEKIFDEVLAINLKGSFLFMQACVRNWIREPKARIKAAKKEGKPIPKPTTFPDKRIINVSSMAAEGNVGQIAYGASKAGVIGMTKTAAKELIQYNIRTHAVMPALIYSPMTDDLVTKDDGKWRKYYESRNPLGIGEPKHVADVILFLCGEESCYMNGAIIPISGGRIHSL